MTMNGMPRGLRPFATEITSYTTNPQSTTPYLIFSNIAADVNIIEIFDSAGTPMTLTAIPPTGPIGTITMFPGGNGPIQWRIPKGSTITIQTVSGTVSAGMNIVNLYN